MAWPFPLAAVPSDVRKLLRTANSAFLIYAFDQICVGMGGLRILGKSWGPDWRKNCLSCTVCGGVKRGDNCGLHGDIKVLSFLNEPSQKFRRSLKRAWWEHKCAVLYTAWWGEMVEGIYVRQEVDE